jgi:flagellar biosynthesis chaperone FliJ
MADIMVTTEDIQAVLSSNPSMALQVQIQTLKRIVEEQRLEIEQLKQDLEKQGTKKEARQNAESRT